MPTDRPDIWRWQPEPTDAPRCASVQLSVPPPASFSQGEKVSQKATDEGIQTIQREE
jgi:hypothetical protein